MTHRIFAGTLASLLLATTIVGHAASIGGPSSSTTGNFTLTWTSGYELRAANASYRYAAPPTTSYAFSDLPSGSYDFELVACTPSGGSPPTYDCVSAATKTVTVSRSTVQALDSTTSEAGTTAYSANTSLRGSAVVNVPIRLPDGVNGLRPELALAYDSSRGSDITDLFTIDDTLGWGWRLAGLDVVHRCRAGASGSPTIELTSSDRLCFNGQPLIAVSGTYFVTGAEYRTAPQSLIKIKQHATWFEVFYPDGRVGRFGDTAGSRVRASGLVETDPDREGLYTGDAPVYRWGVRQVTDGFGSVFTVDYHTLDSHGVLLPERIDYADAYVEFLYAPRSDLLPVTLENTTDKAEVVQLAALHGIRVFYDGKQVRQYRLDNQTVSARLRLENIQECGFNEAGTASDCLRPLAFEWTTVTGGSRNFPIALSELTDGLGAVTEWAYETITTTNNPTTYSEAPFGSIVTEPDITAQDIAVVDQMKRSDGLTSAGRRTWHYAYKSYAYRNSDNFGYIGFYERRLHDVALGRYSYTQIRLTPTLRGQVTAGRTFTGVFGQSGSEEISRFEITHDIETRSNGVEIPIVERRSDWVFSLGTVVGATVTDYAYCFRPLTNELCDDDEDLVEYPTFVVATGDAGTTITDPSFTPHFWGYVPLRSIGGLERETLDKTILSYDTTNWVMGTPTKEIHRHTVPGETTRRVEHEMTYRTGTQALLTRAEFADTATATPATDRLNRTLTRTYTGTRLTSEALSGADIATRTTSYASHIDNRYPGSVTNPLSQSSTLAYDLRFGLPDQVTDPDGNVTSLVYDPFGRLIETTSIDGTVTSIDYERCDQVSCTDADHDAVVALKVTTSQSNNSIKTAPDQVQYIDVLGRVVATAVGAFKASDGQHIQRVVYDGAGRVEHQTIPYFTSGTAAACTGPDTDCTWYTYDDQDRLIKEERPDNGETEWIYTASAGSLNVETRETVARTGTTATESRRKYSTYNVLGQLVSTTDAYGTSDAVTTTYDYDASGNLDYVAIAGNVVAQMTYDLAGNRTYMNESATGETFMDYDALGQVLETEDDRGQITDYTYDKLGRLTQRVDLSGTVDAVTNTWTWDATNATGKLASRSNGEFTETYTYRSADAKLTSFETDIDVTGVHTQTYTHSLTYDSADRQATTVYPNLTINYAYSGTGYQSQIRSGSSVIEELEATNAFGRPTEQRFHLGNMESVRSYDPATGRLTSIETGKPSTPTSLQDLHYLWRSNNTLYSREDKRGTTATSDDLTDSYSYDAMERLTRQATTGVSSRTLDFSYDDFGNLKTKYSNVAGDFDAWDFQTYDEFKLNRVKVTGNDWNLITYNGNITRYDTDTGPDYYISYDGQHNATKITYDTSSSTTTPIAREEFWYDPDGHRYLSRETWDESGTQKIAKVVYIGAYEESYPAAGDTYSKIQRYQVSAQILRVRRTAAAGGAVTGSWRYQFRDHLGSVDAVANAAGDLLHDLSYDPFGGRRDADWGSDVSTSEMNAVMTYEHRRLARGFTDHEHLNRTGFIHMNGRLYDPRIGRVLQADPFVFDPTHSQSYNRYAYVLNTPVSLIDPSGLAPREPPYEDGGGGVQICFTCARVSPRSLLDPFRSPGRRGRNLPFLTNTGGGNPEDGSESVPTDDIVDQVEGNPYSGVIDYAGTAFRWLVFDYQDPLGGSYWLEGATFFPVARPLRGAKFVPKGLLGRSGRDVLGETRLRGLNQNRPLSELTDADIRKTFADSPLTLSNHAISRILDPRTRALGAQTPNDIARLLNKGVTSDAGDGLIRIQQGSLEAIVNPATKTIVTIKPGR